MVIEHLHDHRRARHRLLLVNKLFFKAVVPLLYYNPLIGYTSASYERITREKCWQLEKLAALLLASVIHSQRATSQPQDVTTSAKPFHVAKFLRRYGLGLPDWCSSPLIKDAVQGGSPTTIDYSKLLATPQQWDSCNFHGIIHAIDKWDRDSAGCYLDDDDSWYSSSYYDDNNDNRAFEIHERLSDLLLQCSPDSLETLPIINSDYLHLPDRIPKLRRVLLNMRKMTQEWIDLLVAFVSRHRVTSLRNQPLQIKFGDWDTNFSDSMDYVFGAGSTESLARRQKLCRSNSYRTLLYEAIETPSRIDATPLPNFYSKARNIGLGSLVEFTDGDSYRFFYGDGPKHGTFLQQCNNLTTLELRIRDPDSFSWAVERNLVGGIQRRREHFLCNLERLTITMDASLKVLHDAVIAFGQQLQHLTVPGSISLERISPFDLMSSNQTKVGDWNLPCLKTMDMDLFADSGIYIGQFDCPHLESLSINIHRHFTHRDLSTPPDSDDPIIYVDSVYPSPVWKLSRLRSLELRCKAAMVFDFDSLDHMPVLERLVMVTGDDYQPIPICCIPRLAAYRCHKQTLADAEASSTPNPRLGAKWKDHWDFPRLKDLRLEGSPSSVFCFKWLASCPSLESINLRTCKRFQRLPLLSSSKNAAIHPIKAPSETRPEQVARFRNVDDSGFDQSMVPLVESKLEEITLQGPWITEPWYGLQFLKTVADAIGLGNSTDLVQVDVEGAPTSTSEFKPGSRLMNVTSQYTMTPRDAGTLGFLCVYWWTRQEKYPGRDVPWFEFIDAGFYRPERV
ncbi:hypothetical protein BGZ92_006623 [Podila epicladia]|nr:hypothetical protein BGZ92_006623 [Podila epicladia]